MISRRQFNAASLGLSAAATTFASPAALFASGKSNFGSLENWLGSLVTNGQVAGLVAAYADGSDDHCMSFGNRAPGSSDPMRNDTLFRAASLTKPITAAAVMMLVDDGVWRLDDPVDRWLPELVNRRVIRRLDSPLGDTVPAIRPISLRDLLTMRMGIGAVFADPAGSPLLKKMAELEISPGPSPFAHGSDEFMRRLSEVPLIFQPGERWLYHTGLDVAGVMVERASGMELQEFLRTRLFEPSGMADSSFWISSSEIARMAGAYSAASEQGFLSRDRLFPDASSKPRMQLGGGGLISSARDFLTFGRLLMNGGKIGGHRLLSRKSVAMMASDQIVARVKQASPFYARFWETYGWGLGMCVSTVRDSISRAGRFGWWGGTGTTFFADPSTRRVAVLMTQRMMAAPDDTAMSRQFLKRVFGA